MIEVIFSIDYEIYGNGEGSLRELVYEPAERLKATFDQHDAPFVLFVEVAELEKIEEHNADDAIDNVRGQIRTLHEQGIEIGLHLHPQWYNGRYENGNWHLDYSEYSLCTMPRDRIEHILRRSIAYLRDVLGESGFIPHSFRAGNWLLQPTETVASVLAEKGIKVDSSVFKGGFRRNLNLDYRPARKNGYFWRFKVDVNTCDPEGSLIEIPTHTVMVPFWRMLTAKRLGLERKSPVSRCSPPRMKNVLDYVRLRYPLKLDFCRMTINEMIIVINRIVRQDQENPASYKPVVAIGHTKDLVDYDSIEYFLSFLNMKHIKVTTLKGAYAKILPSA